MRGRVVFADVAVPALGHQLATRADQHRADGYLALGFGAVGHRHGVAHPALVDFVEVGVAHSHSMVAGGLPLMS